VARGPHLAAIQANGLKLIKDGQETVWRIRATDDHANSASRTMSSSA